MDRFQILKHKSFAGMYAVLDSETQSIVAIADDLREAKKIKLDVERMIFADEIIDEAMANPKVAE